MSTHDIDLAEALGQLRRERLLAPLVATDAAQRALWTACDLASMVEGAFGERIDATALDRSSRASWLARLGGSYGAPDVAREDLLGPRFWLLDDAGARAGTVQAPIRLLGSRFLPIYSLYVLPERRGRGIATRFLQRTFELVCAAGLEGIRIGTYWTWQRSLRFYLERRFWVFGWKHDVSFVRDRQLPEWRIHRTDEEVRFAIAGAGGWTDLWRARRRGEGLVLDETPALAEMREAQRSGVEIHGCATLALALAVEGWPLIRSAQAWARRYGSSDVGGPEGLAYKIGVFEAIARESGWVVRTPRIPGLPCDP